MATRATVKRAIYKRVKSDKDFDENYFLGREGKDSDGVFHNGLGWDSTSRQGFAKKVNDEIKKLRTKEGKKKDRYFKYSSFKRKTTLGNVIDEATEKVNDPDKK